MFSEPGLWIVFFGVVAGMMVLMWMVDRDD